MFNVYARDQYSIQAVKQASACIGVASFDSRAPDNSPASSKVVKFDHFAVFH